MPAACPEGIMDVIKSMPLRLTNLALKMDSMMCLQALSDSKPVAAICDGSVHEQECTVLPLLEKALDTFDNSQDDVTVHASIPGASEKSTSLTTLEKLEKLRAAMKKQDAAKKECVEGNTDVKRKSPEKDAKKGKTNSKVKDIEKEKLEQQKKGQNHKEKTKCQKTKQREEKKRQRKLLAKRVVRGNSCR